MNAPDHCTQRIRGDRYMTGNRHRNPRRIPVLLREPLTPEQQDEIARAKAKHLSRLDAVERGEV